MTKDGDAPLEQLMQVLGHSFGDPDLLQTALTHPSALTRRTGRQGPRQKGGQDNQRLEFLGDRVLGLVVAEMLYRTFGKEDEGAMAKRLAALVRQEGLAHVARSIDLGGHLILSRGEAEGGGRDNAATLADACEAVIGAIYLDAGLDAARQFVERHWAELIAADSKPPQDAKTALQEWAQAAGLPLPIYQVVESSGPPHDPTFTVEVRVSGKRTAKASGKSKRAAEQAAAASLMADLRS
jgi:ribonuclease-3